MILSDLLDLAIRSHNNTSFVPDKRGATYIKDYSEELESDLQTIRGEAEKQGADETEIAETLARYEAKYRNYFRGWLHAKSNCLSSMITGPARFPVRRAEKANNRERAHSDAFRAWRDKALKAITRSFKPKATAESELERYQKKLSELQRMHEMMKGANAIIRRADTNMIPDLLALGFSKEKVSDIITPGFMGRVGFMPYQLQNNLAMIKHTEMYLRKAAQRTATIEATGGKKELEIAGATIVFNTEADRVQILFPDKPAPFLIAALKTEAFRWSPSNKAWQRQLTTAGLHAVTRVLPVTIQELINAQK